MRCRRNRFDFSKLRGCAICGQSVFVASGDVDEPLMAHQQKKATQSGGFFCWRVIEYGENQRKIVNALPREPL